MRAVKLTNGIVTDLWEVPALDAYASAGITLIAAPDNVGMGWGYVNGSFVAPPRDIPADKIAQWQAIKAKRDTLKSEGAQVGAYWFHTDADSRIQQLGLKDQARDVLAAGGTTATVLQKLGQDIPWQTMSGVAVPMTVQLSFDVVAAVGDLDALCHYVGLQHRAAMEAAADPSVYDFSGDWPVAFGG